MRSNCLFEAIKAKIKDPKNVSIIVIPGILNCRRPHFMWFDKKDNKVHHFTSVGKSNHIYFNGIYKTLSFEAFESWIIYHSYAKKSGLKIMKKLGLRIVNIPGAIKYTGYCTSLEDETIYIGELPSLDDAEYLKKVLRHNIQVKVIKNSKLYCMSIQQALKFKIDTDIMWRYITPFDPDYNLINLSILGSTNKPEI